jgi:predicted permease
VLPGIEVAEQVRPRLQKEKRFDMKFPALLESMLADMRFGLRQFLKTPALTLAVVLSLAIGVGANTAVFTLLDAAILKPLPVPDPDKLVVIEWSNADGFPSFVNGVRGFGRNTPDGGMVSSSVSAPIHRALARESSAFAAVVGIADADEVSAAAAPTSAEPVDLQYVSANFFQGLNVSPALGRGFLQEEDRAGETPVVIVSHRYWRSRLDGSPSALGRMLRVNGVDARVVGVAPPGFFGLSVGQWTDVYAPLASRSVLDRSAGGTSAEDPASWWVQQVAVLSSRIPASTALAELNGLFRNQVAAIAGSDAEASLPVLHAAPGKHGIQATNGQLRTALWLLMLLVGLLLLIVCANVANLLLARSEGRVRESAVRLALGATPSRIFRQQLIESVMLALAGGSLGVTLGFLLSTLMHDLFQVGRNGSDLFALQLDSRVAGFGVALSLATALLFGLTPAFRAARAYQRDSLGAHSRSISVATLRGPKALVSAQLALCLGALVAAGLLGRSLQGLTAVDLGFDPQNLVYATVNPGLSDFPPDRIESYLGEAQRALEGLPGIASVSRMAIRPLQGGGITTGANIPGNPRAAGFDPAFAVNLNSVGPEAFETLAIPLRSGRSVDRAGNGVVVDQRFAERFFGGEDVLGRRFGTGAPGNDDQYEIVGIVQNVISYQLRAEPLPMLYVPHDAARANGPTHFAIRTAQDPNLLLQSIRTAISSANPSVPLTDLRAQTELLDRMLRSERLLAFLSAGFSLIATALAAVGLAGLLAYAVARRTGEIGLRMALGAAPGRMVAMVMRDSLKLIVAGLVVGIPCAYGIAKLLESSLYELAPADPATMTASILTLLAISLVAAFLPALRAAKTAPSAALRED